jgi:Holliday junction resolvase RusA-like endonuclease
MIVGYVVHIQPVTSNHAYATNRKGRRFMTTEARRYKKEIAEAMAAADVKRGRPQFKPTATIELSIACLYPRSAEKGGTAAMYTIAGRMRKRDATGPLKLTEDAVSEYIGIDDSQNLSVHIHKRSHDEIGCKIVIAVSEIDDGAAVMHRKRRIC